MSTSFLEQISLQFKTKDIHDIIEKNPCVVFIAGLIANQFLDDKNLVVNTCQICMALSIAKIAKSYDEKVKNETKKKKELIESSEENNSDENDSSSSPVEEVLPDVQQSSSNNVHESDSSLSPFSENTFQAIDSGQENTERPPISEVETTDIIEAMVVNELPVNTSVVHSSLPQARNRGSPVTAVLVQEDPSELLLNGMRPMSLEIATERAREIISAMEQEDPQFYQRNPSLDDCVTSAINRARGISNHN